MLHFESSSLVHNVTLFDVGHGDCVLVKDGDPRCLLVDCGAKSPNNYRHVSQFIQQSVSNGQRSGLLISHYHKDHFSLFPQFLAPDRLFSRAYIPSLPMSNNPGVSIGRAVMTFISLATAVGLQGYRIIPQIFSTLKSVKEVKKGDTVMEAGLEFDVIWPDLHSYALQRKSIRMKAKELRLKLEPYLEKYDIDPAKDYSMSDLVEGTRKIAEEQLDSKADNEVREILGTVEEDFRVLANEVSVAMVTKDHSPSRFLFLGDLPGPVLSRIEIPGPAGFDCVKSSHHGTEFGKGLDGKDSSYLLVSRDEKSHSSLKPIHQGYYYQMNSRLILRTDLLGSCIIG